eukprot:TRINITY_DN64676_c0_g1_i1.p1 TRINITY_DN64676_c0_g1~~TRINITY_DN64676_c0_g1_i1.p1  ORF type:complete len:379 (-),score=62.92 TRINITY_DN64676_c0_g1_i1:157-1227(-)
MGAGHPSEEEQDWDVVEETLPVTVEHLEQSKPGAWQIFLDHMGSCLPGIHVSSSGDRGVVALALASTLTLQQQVQLLRGTCNRVSLAMTASLSTLRHGNQGFLPMLSHSLPAKARDTSQFQALATLREIELGELKAHRESHEQDVNSSVSACEKMGAMLCELRGLREAMVQRRFVRIDTRRKKAKELLGLLGEVRERLQQLQVRKAELFRARRSRACRAEKDTRDNSPGAEPVLVFRGKHRLRINRHSYAASLCCVRFEPCVPGGSSSNASGDSHGVPQNFHQLLLSRFEEHLFHIWVRALNPTLEMVEAKDRSAAVIPWRDVPALVQRLQLGLIDAADLIQQMHARLCKTPMLAA